MAPDLSTQNIAFIGGGNMAAAIIAGLVKTSLASAKTQIHVSEPWDVNRAKVAALGVRTTTSNAEAARGADVLVLAVKPQVARPVLEELAAGGWSHPPSDGGDGDGDGSRPLPLLVSIAAGVTAGSLRRWATAADGRAPPVVRVMPNTPALLGEGASGLFAGEGVSDDQRALAGALVGSVSKVAEWVEREELLDVVTGLSGSGPAYFFALVEHLVAAATKLGLDEGQAVRLASQTCLGAGRVLAQGTETPTELRRNVTSPNGTTEAAIKSFDASGFDAIVDKAVRAATARGEELGRTLGES